MVQAPVDHDRLAAVCRRYGIQRLRMFGSAAEGESSDRSDVDLLVEFIPGEAPGAFALVDLQDELSVLFGGKSIDLAFPSILRNPYRRRAIEPQLRPLYG
ncbi:MAG: nucleotidyltransferase domain-containing protein [Ideonella sp.]|nr:nucleotidyltransferase domain-containing protein [Ideonella sp.]